MSRVLHEHSGSHLALFNPYISAAVLSDEGALHESRKSCLALVNSNVYTVFLPDESMLSAHMISNDINVISSMNVHKSTRTRTQRSMSEMKESVVTLNKKYSSHDISYDDNNDYDAAKHTH